MIAKRRFFADFFVFLDAYVKPNNGMTIEERDKLLEEVGMLKILLDFHVQNRQYISMSDHEFEEYANAVLDRLNELNDLLDFKNLSE